MLACVWLTELCKHRSSTDAPHRILFGRDTTNEGFVLESLLERGSAFVVVVHESSSPRNSHCRSRCFSSTCFDVYLSAPILLVTGSLAPVSRSVLASQSPSDSWFLFPARPTGAVPLSSCSMPVGVHVSFFASVSLGSRLVPSPRLWTPSCRSHAQRKKVRAVGSQAASRRGAKPRRSALAFKVSQCNPLVGISRCSRTVLYLISAFFRWGCEVCAPTCSVFLLRAATLFM